MLEVSLWALVAVLIRFYFCTVGFVVKVNWLPDTLETNLVLYVINYCILHVNAPPIAWLAYLLSIRLNKIWLLYNHFRCEVGGSTTRDWDWGTQHVYNFIPFLCYFSCNSCNRFVSDIQCNRVWNFVKEEFGPSEYLFELC